MRIILYLGKGGVGKTTISAATAVRSALHDKPFPLQGVKILDFAWFLASARSRRALTSRRSMTCSTR